MQIFLISNCCMSMQTQQLSSKWQNSSLLDDDSPWYQCSLYCTVCLFSTALPWAGYQCVFTTLALNYKIDSILTDEEFHIHQRVGEGKVNCLTSIPAYSYKFWFCFHSTAHNLVECFVANFQFNLLTNCFHWFNSNFYSILGVSQILFIDVATFWWYLCWSV